MIINPTTSPWYSATRLTSSAFWICSLTICLKSVVTGAFVMVACIRLMLSTSSFFVFLIRMLFTVVTKESLVIKRRKFNQFLWFSRDDPPNRGEDKPCRYCRSTWPAFRSSLLHRLRTWLCPGVSRRPGSLHSFLISFHQALFKAFSHEPGYGVPIKFSGRISPFFREKNRCGFVPWRNPNYLLSRKIQYSFARLLVSHFNYILATK